MSASIESMLNIKEKHPAQGIVIGRKRNVPSYQLEGLGKACWRALPGAVHKGALWLSWEKFRTINLSKRGWGRQLCGSPFRYRSEGKKGGGKKKMSPVRSLGLLPCWAFHRPGREILVPFWGERRDHFNIPFQEKMRVTDTGRKGEGKLACDSASA